jgi:hypothetical protein
VSSAHDAPEQAWLFLAVLMSTSPAKKDDDVAEPARVRGLGFVHGDVIVTLAHIAKEADIAQLPGVTMPLRVRETAAEGALALMKPQTESSIPSWPQLTVRPLSAGEPVTVAFVSDISPSAHLVPGYGRPSEPEDRFTVTLDGRLGEDETASGSPVVAGDAVVGIVSPDATSGWVSAFGAEAVRRLLATYTAGPPAPPPLSAATLRALGYALDVVDDVGPGPAVLLGVLRTGAEGPGESVPAQLLSRLNAGRDSLSVEREVDALRGDARNDPKGLTDEQIRNSAIGRIVRVAESVQVQVGDERLHRRHLLAAALSKPATEFSLPTVERTLGLSLPDLREAVREIIAGTHGPNAAWDAVLAEPAPIDLAGGVSADLVDPTTGIPLTEDHLGLGVDVTMFATLIADKSTPMPLSIGLFGEWGSGKSYFMGLLRQQIQQLSTSSDPRYRSKIAQIGFNAWHYADSNLWASLGDEIFEQLAEPTAQSTDEQRDALRHELDDRLQRRKELRAATERAEAETKRLTTELDDAKAKRRGSAQALAKAVLGSDELNKKFKPALHRLGVTKASEQIQVLTEELEQTPEDVTDVRRAVARLPRWQLAAGIVIAVAAIVTGIVFSQYLAGVGVAVLTLLTTAGGIAARVRSGARLLHQVADGLRREQVAAVAEQRAALLQAETQERMLQTQLDDVIEQVGELNRELADLTPGQQLYRFVAMEVLGIDPVQRLVTSPATREHLAMVAVKNHRHGVNNPKARRARRERHLPRAARPDLHDPQGLRAAQRAHEGMAQERRGRQ